MTILYTIADENGDLIREGKCDIADVHYVVWNELDNGHTVVVSPDYEGEENEH